MFHSLTVSCYHFPWSFLFRCFTNYHIIIYICTCWPPSHIHCPSLTLRKRPSLIHAWSLLAPPPSKRYHTYPWGAFWPNIQDKFCWVGFIFVWLVFVNWMIMRGPPTQNHKDLHSRKFPKNFSVKVPKVKEDGTLERDNKGNYIARYWVLEVPIPGSRHRFGLL